MTAKHRKSKNNHKHEENFFKNDVVESEVRNGVNSFSVHLVLFLVIVLGGAVGLWFCIQQHQTLTQLTDSVAGMQMKIMKLQSAHEEFRQSGTKRLSESLETRLNALEESNSLAQKQLGMALATAEQLRSSDLPAQVLSLHTEMKTRLAEMQRATVSLEQLSQLQATLKGKSEEFEGVRRQVDGLALLGSELSQKVEVLAGSLREMESKLEDRSGHVTMLSNTLDTQVTLVHSLKEQVEACQGQLETRTHDIATVRELLQSEDLKWLQQTSMEEQLSTLRQSLQGQISAAHNLTSGLQARVEDIQKQVTQLVEKSPADPKDEAPPADPVEPAPPNQPQDQAPPSEPEDQAIPSEPQDQAPPSEPEDQAAPSEPQEQAPPAKPELALPAEEDAAARTEEEQHVPSAGIEEEAAPQGEAQQKVFVIDGVAPAEDTLALKEDVDPIEAEGGVSLTEELPEEPEVQQESIPEQKKDEMLREEEPQEVNQLEEELPVREEEEPAGDEEEPEEVLGTDEDLTEESQSEMEMQEEVEEDEEQPAPEEDHEEEDGWKGNDEEQDFPGEWESHSREETDEGQEVQ